MITYSNTILYYNIYLTYAVPYLIANATRLKLSTEQVTQLGDMLTAWNVAMEKYLNPEKHGDLSTNTINHLHNTFVLITDAIKQQLKNNASIELDETDYLVIDIHKDAVRRKKLPKPTQEAVVFVESTRHLYNVYRVIDKAKPTKKGKPTDVQRILRKMMIKKATDPAPTIKDMPQISSITTITYDIPFTDENVGDLVYMAVCFSNDTGNSEWSEIIVSPII